MEGQDLADIFRHLFADAEARGGVEYVFTLTRVAGISSDPDPLTEAKDGLQSNARLDRDWYCSLLPTVEVALGLIYNLIRCSKGEPYDISPFGDRLPLAVRRRAEDRPAEVAVIAEHAASAAAQSGYDELAKRIGEAFPRRVLAGCRDEQGPEVDETSTHVACFGLLRTLLDTYAEARLVFRNRPRLYRLPRFEVLELLVDEDVGLNGFKVHFSTGTSASFVRDRSGTDGRNISPDVPLGFSIGMSKDVKEEWRVGDRRIHEIGIPGRFNRAGEWRPLIFPGDPSKFEAEAREISEDPDVQGAYFYILCTGHWVLEFAAVMSLEFPSRITTYVDRVHLVKVTETTEDSPSPSSFIYDGWVDLEEPSSSELARALDLLSRLFNRMSLAVRSPVAWRSKYSFRAVGGGVWHPGDESLEVLNALLAAFPAGPDGEAMDVAVDWYNRGEAASNPLVAFLCFYIAIESVVHAIYDGAADFGLELTKLSRNERRKERRTCIHDLLEQLYEQDPEQFVQAAYFECLKTVKKRIREVIAAVFGARSREEARLFSATEGPALHEIRSSLAHGLTSELTPGETHAIRASAGLVGHICRDFLLRLLLRVKPDERLPEALQTIVGRFSFDDPRNLRVVSSEEGLPTRDWSIKREWIGWP
jgi:hypothetical protein